MKKLHLIIAFMISLAMFSSNVFALTYSSTATQLSVDTTLDNSNMIIPIHANNSWYITYQTQQLTANYPIGVYVSKFTDDLTTRLNGFTDKSIALGANNDNRHNSADDYKYFAVASPFSGDRIVLGMHTTDVLNNICNTYKREVSLTDISTLLTTSMIGRTTGTGTCQSYGSIGVSSYMFNYNTSTFRWLEALGSTITGGTTYSDVSNPATASVSFTLPADETAVSKRVLVYSTAKDKYLLFFHGSVALNPTGIWVNYFNTAGTYLGRQLLFSDYNNASVVLRSNNGNIMLSAMFNSTLISIAEFEHTSSITLTTVGSTTFNLPNSNSSVSVVAQGLGFNPDDNTTKLFYIVSGSSAMYYLSETSSGGAGVPTQPYISQVKLDSIVLVNDTQNNVPLGEQKTFALYVTNPSSTESFNVTLGLSLGG